MGERVNEIVERCEGSILDIGCVQHSLERIKSDSWLHGVLCNQFNDVVGMDILEEEIQELSDMGYNVVHGDAENFKLDKKFDTIVAGELIEHLANPGNFLECCAQHLKDNGKLVLTTPNPYWIEYTIRRAFNRLDVNPEHTALYDEVVITQLLDRYDLKAEVNHVVERFAPKTFKGFIWHKIVFPLLLRVLPKEFTANRLLIVAIKEGS